MIDIDITVRGGAELWKTNPKKYDKLLERVSSMFLDFPGVGCCCIGPTFETDADRKKREDQEKISEARQREELKTALIGAFKEPAVRAKIDSVQAEAPAEEVSTA